MVLMLVPAPIFVLFELWQLFISERYLGIKQIERGVDPRKLGLRELTASIWTLFIAAYWVWMVGLLFLREGRVLGLCLLAISVAGYSVRRNCGLKWVLVVLTFEGAIRIGLLVYLCAYFWQRM